MSVEYDRLYERLSIKDKDNPYSLVNLCSEYIAEKIMSIPDDTLDRAKKPRPDDEFSLNDEMLRIAFWEEYRRAVRLEARMVMSNIYGGIMTQRGWEFLARNPERLAYIITPPKEIHVAMEALVHLGLKKMEEILTLSVYDSKGEVNPKLAGVQHRIFEDLMNRRRGHVLQKIETTSRNLNVNVDTTPKEAKRLSLDEIERKIAELESNQHQPLIEVKNVREEEV